MVAYAEQGIHQNRHWMRKMPLMIHIVCAVFNLAYVYTPLHMWSSGLWVVQFISMPLLLLSGILIGKRKKRLS